MDKSDGWGWAVLFFVVLLVLKGCASGTPTKKRTGGGSSWYTSSSTSCGKCGGTGWVDCVCRSSSNLGRCSYCRGSGKSSCPRCTNLTGMFSNRKGSGTDPYR